MLDFILEHLLEIIFALISASVFWQVRKQSGLLQKVKNYDKIEMEKDIVKQVAEEVMNEKNVLEAKDVELAKEIAIIQDETKSLKVGLLSLQGKQYREQCEELLEKTHTITVEEFEQEEEDYHAYKELKGNHRGDALHNAVVAKFNGNLN